MLPTNPNDSLYQRPTLPAENERPVLEQQSKPENRVFKLFIYTSILWFFIAIINSLIGLFAGMIGFLIIFSIIFGGGIVLLLVVYSILYRLMKHQFMWLNERLKFRYSMIVWTVLIAVSMALLLSLTYQLMSFFYTTPAKQVNVSECEELAKQIVDDNSMPNQEYFDKGCTFESIDKIQEQKNSVTPEIKTLNYKASIFGIDFNFDYQSNQNIRAQSWGYVLDFGDNSLETSKHVYFRFVDSYPEVFESVEWNDYTKTTISGYPARKNFNKLLGAGALIGDRLLQVVCSYSNDPTPEQNKEFLAECEKVANTLKITNAPVSATATQNSGSATAGTSSGSGTNQATNNFSSDSSDLYNIFNPTNYEKTTGYKPAWIYGSIVSFSDTQLVVAEEGKNQNLTLPITSDVIITDGTKKAVLVVGAHVNIEYEGFTPVHVLRIQI